MIQDKSQIKEQRTGKVAKKTKSLPKQGDHKSAGPKGAAGESNGPSGKFQIKSDKKKGAKMQKRTMSQSSQKDNIQKPELDAQNVKNFNLD